MGQPPAPGRPRGPEDGLPRQAPIFEEEDALRWEMPVVVGRTRGTLVIRVFRCVDDPRVSIRGQVVEAVRARR